MSYCGQSRLGKGATFRPSVNLGPDLRSKYAASSKPHNMNCDEREHARVSLAVSAAAPKAAVTELPNVLTDMMEMGSNQWVMNVHHTILIMVNIYQSSDMAYLRLLQ